MMVGIIFIIFLTELNAQPATTDWFIETIKDTTRDKESIILSKRSIDKQIFNYERLYGWLSIRSNGEKVDIDIKWGGFISVGRSYVKYRIGDNELRGDSWLISGEYDITVAPDPFLMLLQMSISEKAVFYTTPKGLTQVSYSFELEGLKEVLDQYTNLFKDYAGWVSSMNDSTDIPRSIDPFHHNVNKYFQQENIFRRLSKKIDQYPAYTLRPIWHIDPIRTRFELILPEQDVFFYYNKWMKETGILFTRNDLRFIGSRKGSPHVVKYHEIDTFELIGNALTGYRYRINGEDLYTIFKSEPGERKAIQIFLLSMSDLEKKYRTN